MDSRKLCMSKLVDMAFGQRIKPTSLDLTAETVNPLDVDERPPPIVKMMDAQQHAHILATFSWTIHQTSLPHI
jgi:hypothetical protein